LLHRVAFRILYACSVVFMIMRFPLRVVAIGGVEAGSGKGGRHVSVFFAWSGSLHHRRVLLSFPSGVTLKIIGERKLAGLKNRCDRMYDLRQQAALWSMQGNTRFSTWKRGGKGVSLPVSSASASIGGFSALQTVRIMNLVE
jgi:hypothetical protein